MSCMAEVALIKCFLKSTNSFDSISCSAEFRHAGFAKTHFRLCFFVNYSFIHFYVLLLTQGADRPFRPAPVITSVPLFVLNTPRQGMHQTASASCSTDFSSSRGSLRTVPIAYGVIFQALKLIAKQEYHCPQSRIIALQAASCILLQVLSLSKGHRGRFARAPRVGNVSDECVFCFQGSVIIVVGCGGKKNGLAGRH